MTRVGAKSKGVNGPVDVSPGAALTADPSGNERLLTPQKPDGKPLFVAYARVSTEKQADHGVSLDAQTAKFRGFADAKDFRLAKVEWDALSGKDTNRPGLQRALAMLERGEAVGLVVHKLDRLTRDVGDFEDLLERYFRKGGFQLLSISDSIDTRTANGRFQLRIQMAMAEWERETIAERTKDALAFARTQGGGTPRVDGAAAARIRELAAGGVSLRGIARALTDEGVPTLKGGKWAAETVRKVLDRPSDLTSK